MGRLPRTVQPGTGKIEAMAQNSRMLAGQGTERKAQQVYPLYDHSSFQPAPQNLITAAAPRSQPVGGQSPNHTNAQPPGRPGRGKGMGKLSWGGSLCGTSSPFGS